MQTGSSESLIGWNLEKPLMSGTDAGSVAIESVHIVPGFRVHFGSRMTHENLKKNPDPG